MQNTHMKPLLADITAAIDLHLRDTHKNLHHIYNPNDFEHNSTSTTSILSYALNETLYIKVRTSIHNHEKANPLFSIAVTTSCQTYIHPDYDKYYPYYSYEKTSLEIIIRPFSQAIHEVIDELHENNAIPWFYYSIDHHVRFMDIGVIESTLSDDMLRMIDDQIESSVLLLHEELYTYMLGVNIMRSTLNLDVDFCIKQSSTDYHYYSGYIMLDDRRWTLSTYSLKQYCLDYYKEKLTDNKYEELYDILFRSDNLIDIYGMLGK